VFLGVNADKIPTFTEGDGHWIRRHFVSSDENNALSQLTKAFFFKQYTDNLSIEYIIYNRMG
jgi:hypothetical protein